VILVPMRHEEAVAGHTLERLANLDHPDYWVMPIVDHPDDPGTAAIAHAKAAQYPGRVLVAAYPEDTDVHNKPIGLNAAVRVLEQAGIDYEWLGVADAEDLFHTDLLRMVDYRFRRTRAGIVQCGVQLMNFSAHPSDSPLPDGRLRRLRRWLRSTASGWWRAANVLEYYKWFQSRLKLQAAVRVMPLGGNTVFFRRAFLDAMRDRYGACWDEDCLTEDCKIGIVASVLDFPVDVVYIDHMVTREETPQTLPGLVRQRVRWMQGFIQVFIEGEWLALPRLWQKILAVYVLGFQFFQAFAIVFAPFALLLALSHKSPVLVAMLACLPLGISLLTVALDILMLHQFGRTFGQKVRLRDYLGVALGAYPYQAVLSVAGLWAVLRHLLGRTNWVKTTHAGAHLTTAPHHADHAEVRVDVTTGHPVTITTTSGHTRWEPATTVAFVGADASGGPSADCCCDHLNFFTDQRAARAWTQRPIRTSSAWTDALWRLNPDQTSGQDRGASANGNGFRDRACSW
jgi:glycosyltransferase XagB